MKSLEERKKQRKQQRAENLKDSPFQDTGVIQEIDAVSNASGKQYADMTIEELKAAAKALGTEVPKEKTVKADILEYVQNLAKFKAEQSGGDENKNDGWNANN